jgi:hypothetical protein
MWGRIHMHDFIPLRSYPAGDSSPNASDARRRGAGRGGDGVIEPPTLRVAMAW